MLNRIERALRSAVLVVCRRSGWTILVCAAIAAASLAALPALRQVVRLEDQLDSRFESARDLVRLEALFPKDPNLFLIRHGKFGRAELCEVRRELSALRERVPDLTALLSPLDLRRVLSEPGRVTYPRLLGDPCLEPGPGLEALRGTPWAASWTDRSGQDFLALLHVREAAKPGPFGLLNAGALTEILASPGEWIGPGARDFHTWLGMLASQGLNGILAVLLLLGCRAVFGTWKSGLILFGTLGLSSGLVLGLMSAMGWPMDLLSVSLILVLAFATLEDFVFLSFRQANFRGDLRRHAVALVTPGFFTSLSTLIGFGSLTISELPMIRRFGASAAIGSLAEWAAVFLVLPAAAGRFPSLERWVRPERALTSRKAWAWLAELRPPRGLARAALLVFVFAIAAIPRLTLEQDPSEMFPKGHPFRSSVEKARATMGWVAVASLVSEKAPGAEVLAALRSDRTVAGVESGATVLEFLLKGIEDPARRALVEREFRQSPLADHYWSHQGPERALIYLRGTNTGAIDSLRRKVAGACPDHSCFLAGDVIAFSDFSQVFIRTLVQSFFMSLVLVAAVLAFVAQGEGILALLLSSFFGPAAILALIGWGGVLVNSVTCIVASTLVGLTGDNAIQFLFARRSGGIGGAIDRLGGASFQTMLLSSVACLPFLVSPFDPPRKLGLLLIGGLLVTTAGDVWLLRGLAKSATRAAPR